MWILVKVTQVTFLVDGKDELRLVLARASNRAEAGSTCLDDLFVSCRVEDPSSRVARVNTALHQNSHGTPARSLHDVHVARCVQNSMNSLGDGAVRGRGVCVPG